MVNDIESFELSLRIVTTRKRGKYLHIKDLFSRVPRQFSFFRFRRCVRHDES